MKQILRRGAAGAILALVLAIGVHAQSPAPSAAPAGGGSKAVVGGLTLSGTQAGWRGLYAGRSTTADVTAVLGPAASNEKVAGGLTRIVYGPDADLKFNSVYVDDAGLVKKIGWAMFEENMRIPPKELWSGLGEPKMVSPFSFVKQGSIFHWEGAAVWGVVDRERNAVLSLVFYDPKDKPEIPVPSGPPKQ